MSVSASLRRGLSVRPTATAMALLLCAAACSQRAADAPQPQAQPLDEVRTFEVASRKHVSGRVTYPQTPPVGGDHAPDVQPCGFYTKPVSTERGVHTMEHGAVWVTYRPNVSAPDRETLHALTRDEHYLLVSPWEHGLPAPVVASAWGRQVMLASASDPELASFIKQFASGAQAPEPHAYC